MSNRKRYHNTFEDTSGNATGVIKVRIMAAAKDVVATLDAMQATGIHIKSISKPYSNKRGNAVRVYLDIQLKENQTS